MGKRKGDHIQFIKDKNLRNITYHKRKRGLLKKLIELACLCDLDIYMFMLDKEKNRMVEFKSGLDFGNECVQSIKDKIKNASKDKKY